jgi:hypothetical protein
LSAGGDGGDAAGHREVGWWRRDGRLLELLRMGLERLSLGAQLGKPAPDR